MKGVVFCWLLESLEVWWELGGRGACVEGTKGSLEAVAETSSLSHSLMDCLEGLTYSTVVFGVQRLNGADGEEVS